MRLALSFGLLGVTCVVIAAVAATGQSPAVPSTQAPADTPPAPALAPIAPKILIVPPGPTTPMPNALQVPPPQLDEAPPVSYTPSAPPTPTLVAPQYPPEIEKLKRELRRKDNHVEYLEEEIAKLGKQLAGTEQVTVDVRFLKINLSKAADVDLGLDPEDQKRFLTTGVSGLIAGRTASTGDARVDGSGVQLDRLLAKLEENSALKIIAKPTIATGSGSEARLAIIHEVPFQQLTQTGEGAQIGTTSFREVGTRLLVEPKILNGKRIRLELEAEWSELDLEQTRQLANGQPVVKSQQIQSSVVIESGTTVAVGGSITEITQNDESQRTELVILVTPRIGIDAASQSERAAAKAVPSPAKR